MGPLDRAAKAEAVFVAATLVVSVVSISLVIILYMLYAGAQWSVSISHELQNPSRCRDEREGGGQIERTLKEAR